MTVQELIDILAPVKATMKVRVVKDERMDEINDVRLEENYGEGHYIVLDVS